MAVNQPLAARIIKGLGLVVTVPIMFIVGVVVGGLYLVLVPLIVLIPILAIKMIKSGDKMTYLYFENQEKIWKKADVLKLFVFSPAETHNDIGQNSGFTFDS